MTSSTAASTVTATSANFYQGTIQLAISGTGPTNACYAISGRPSLTMGSTATTTIQIFTGTTCATTKAAVKMFNSGLAESTAPHGTGSGLTLAGVFCLGVLLLGRRKRFPAVLGVMMLLLLPMFTGCSGSNTSVTTTPTVPTTSSTGVFTLTVTGTDTITNTNVASTMFTLTIQ